MAMGGVGEAMLLGAAMGGGTSALMGRDPLKGALIGGLTGGAGAGVSSALGAGAETAALAGSTNMAPTVANANAMTAANAMTPTVANAAAQNAAQNTATGLGSGTFGTGAMPGVDSFQSVITPSAPVNIPYSPPSGINSLPAASATPQTFSEGAAKFASDPIASLGRNRALAAGSSLAAINATRPEDYIPPEYRMKGLRFSDDYRAAYAEGGIASLGAEGYDRMVGEQPMYQGMASGGISSLGSYSDGGRMLKGPGDGMSDDIPATIANKRPARLARDEFVVPADVVSHLGNGSSDAGAKQLYAMMDRVRQARTGRKSQGREINPRKYMAA
jgi:hypothetical protein